MTTPKPRRTLSLKFGRADAAQDGQTCPLERDGVAIGGDDPTGTAGPEHGADDYVGTSIMSYPATAAPDREVAP